MRSDPIATSIAAPGFTLIEAVVALLIVALGMTAVFTQLNYFATTSYTLQEKTLASWIGSNIVTTQSLAISWPEPGVTEDQIEFAGSEWSITIEVTETDVERLRRVDVDVALADRPERVIHTVSGLIEPPTSDMGPLNWTRVRQGQGQGQGGLPGEVAF